MSWATLLKSHWEVLAAKDFFTIDVMTLRGLVLYHVLFVIEQCTRRVESGGREDDQAAAAESES